jgi:nitrate reductase gamma subunit
MTLHDFFYGVYPYLAGTVFLVGSLVRFEREQYTWKADSSQFLANRGMRVASNLFHIGIIAIFFGHLVGLLTPHAVFRALGVGDMDHQVIAIAAGSLFGLMCLAGGALLWLRRLANRRVRAAQRAMDFFILTWLLATLLLGLSTIPVSIGHAAHGDPGVMLALAEWAQSIVGLHPNPAAIATVDPIFKVHLVFGMTVFLLFPFSRLVHIWSVPIGYLWRAYQVVRTRRTMAR